MKNIDCPGCGVKQQAADMGEYRNATPLFASRRLLKCEICKLIFVHPMPSLVELEEYYANEWYNDKTSAPLFSHEGKIVCHIQAEERCRYFGHHLKGHGVKKVLDVGAGLGYINEYINIYLDNDITYHAIEYNQSNIDLMEKRGIRAQKGYEGLEPASYDLITCCFVLEHITEPNDFLQRLLIYLKDGGHIYIDIPDRDDLFKDYLDSHVLFFDKESFTNLILKNGLKIKHLTGYGQMRSELIKEYCRMKHGLKPEWFKRLWGYQLYLLKFLKLDNLHVRHFKRFEYYYRLYDKEGDDRWWLRALLQKGS